MSQQYLYLVATNEGVTALLTHDAYSAYTEAHLRRFGARADAVIPIDPRLLSFITSGTMTFAEAAQWNKKLHTGTISDLEKLKRQHKVIIVNECPFPVPFSSNDPGVIEQELKDGYRPNRELLAELVKAS